MQKFKTITTAALTAFILTTPAIGQADGKSIFDESCASCHTGGIKGWLTGAPELGDKEAWAPLIKEGVEHLTAVTMAGKESMPAKGGCEDCTEADIAAAVQYLVDQSQ